MLTILIFLLFYVSIALVGDKMSKSNVFAEFIHANAVTFKHAKGMRDIFGLEFHPFHEIFLFLDGDAEFISGTTRQTLKKNSLVIIPKESFHHFVVNGPEDEYHRYVLNFTAFGRLGELIEEKMQEICVFPASDEMLSHFERLKKYTAEENQYKKELVLEAALTDILLAIDAPNAESDNMPPSVNPIVRDAVKYINNNVKNISCIEDISSAVNVSESYFSHLFKKELHISPSKYLLEKKLVMANRMIDSGVGAVVAAEQCGFVNYSGFYKMYKKAFGCSPSKTKKASAK